MTLSLRSIGARFLIAAIIGALGATNSPLHAQSASLLGSVLLDGKETPLANAEILIPSLKLSTRSDSLGKFALGGIAPGKHAVTVRLIGHAPLTLDLDFKASQPGDVDFILTPNMTELKEVKVRDTKTKGPWAIKLAEFDERRAMGIGKFLTQDYFLSRDGRPTSSFLKERIAGLDFAQKNGRRYAVSTRGCGGRCPESDIDKVRGCLMQIVVNGIVRFNGLPGQQAYDLDELPSSDIIGFEFYQVATTPLQFRNSSPASNCGTIVIWSKGG